MARVICIANQKGGVGKTTTTVNLSAALSLLNKRVLIIDLDPQGNASSGLGIKKYENSENNIYHVLVGQKMLSQVIQNSQLDLANQVGHLSGVQVANSDELNSQVEGKSGQLTTQISIAPANPDLVGAEIELVDMPRREYRLKAAIEQVSDDYDYVLIDCPPSLGLLTVNALTSANSFLVPLQCEYYALEGLSQLLNTAGIIKKNLNPDLRIEGIVLTMFDARNNLSHQVVTEIQSHFKDKVFTAIIPRNVRLSEAPSHGQSIFAYDPKSIGAKKYLELAQELVSRTSASVGAHSEINATSSETSSEVTNQRMAQSEEHAPAEGHIVQQLEEPSQPIEQNFEANISLDESVENISAANNETKNESIVDARAEKIDSSEVTIQVETQNDGTPEDSIEIENVILTETQPLSVELKMESTEKEELNVDLIVEPLDLPPELEAEPTQNDAETNLDQTQSHVTVNLAAAEISEEIPAVEIEATEEILESAQEMSPETKEPQIEEIVLDSEDEIVSINDVPSGNSKISEGITHV